MSTSASVDLGASSSNSSGGGGAGPSYILTGTLAQMNAATGFSGQQFFNTTYSAWFSWMNDRWWPLGNPDPRYGFVLAWEDFTGQDRIGTLDWSNGSQAAGYPMAPGLYTINNGAIGTVVRIGGQVNAIQLGVMDIYLETVVSFPNLGVVGDAFCFTWGLSDTSAFDANGNCTDGAYIILNQQTNGTKFQIATASNSTISSASAAAGQIAVAGSTSHRLGIIVSGGTSVQYFINGSSMGTISSNIPSGPGRQTGFNYCLHKNIGSTAYVMNVDYFSCYGFFNNQRAP